MSAALVLLLLFAGPGTALAAPAPLPLEPAPPPLRFEIPLPPFGLDRPPLSLPAPPPLASPVGAAAPPGLPAWRTLLSKPLPTEPPPGQLACLTRLFGGAEALYACGRFQFHQGLPRGDFREAQRAFTELLRTTPHHPLAPAARYWLGEIAFRREPRAQAAPEEFQLALQAGLTGELAAHARLGLAWAALLAGEPSAAQAPLEELLRAPAPGLAELGRFLLAVAHLFQGRPREALALLEELGRNAPSWPLAEEVLFWQGQALWRLGEPARAREAFERFIAAAPTHPLLLDAIMAAGWLVLEQGGAEEAIRKLLWAEAIAPAQGGRLSEVRAGLVRTYLALGDWRRAREAARQLARDAPSSPLLLPTWLELADEAARRGRLAEAVEAYQAVFALYPKAPLPVERYATYRLAEVLERLGRSPEASRRYRELARAGDEAVAQRARYRLGRLALQARDYAAARVEGERLLRGAVSDELRERALLLIAEAAFGAGDLACAAETWRQYLHVFPDSPRSWSARASLAWTLGRLGEPTAALELWEAVAAGRDADLTPRALLAIAGLAIQRGETDRAIETLTQFLAGFPEDPMAEVAGLARAVLLLRSEKFEAASAQLRALLVQFPLTPRQAEIRKALGLAAYRQGRFETALAEFGQAAILSPTEDPEAWLATGIAALSLGRLAEAEEAFARARRAAPRPLALEAEYGLVVVAAREDPERFRARARSFVDRLPEAPQTASLLYALAGLAIERGELAEAAALIRRLVQEHGGSEYSDDALFRLGTAAGAAPSLVRDLFQELLARYPESPFRDEVRYRLAEAARALGDHALAARALEAFAADSPEDPRLPQSLVLLMESQAAAGQKAEAMATAEAFLRRFGAHDLAPSVQLHRGRLLLEQRQWTPAREALQAALRGDEPTAAHAQYLLGEAHREAGEPEEAVAAYMATAYLYPGTAWAQRGLLGAAESYLALGRAREAEVVLRKLMVRPDLLPELARRASQALSAAAERQAKERAETPGTPAKREGTASPRPGAPAQP